MIAPLILAESGGIADIAKETALQFGFNPTLFFSQVISFIIVATLLNKFAYKPIINILEERRQKIAEGLENAEKIKLQLADAEAKHAEIIQRANSEAQRLIDEARASAASLAEKRQQQAVAEAENIVTKAREATKLERERVFSELRREVANLVVKTTGKVTGKILTVDDQKRLSEEATREIAA
jgi:F-type H+-transporting ATPase subunit b